MTDAKELAAEHAEALRNIGQDVLSVAELGMLRRAAAALEAQAEENERLRRVVESNLGGKPLEGEDLAWAEATVLQQQATEIAHLVEKITTQERSARKKIFELAEANGALGARLSALEQAAAPFVRAWLLRRLRWLEGEYDTLLTRQAAEDTDAARDMHHLRAQHAEALRDAEELGYARGLADGRALVGAPYDPA